MWRLRVRRILLILSFAATEAKDPELPLCPTNMQYFPQNLPMHCRMPGTVPPFPSQVYQNPLPGKQSLPMAVPLPGLPGPMPLPMVPMPPAPVHKLPVRKRRPKDSFDEDSTDMDSSTETDDDSTDISSERGWWRGPRSGRRSNRHHKSEITLRPHLSTIALTTAPGLSKAI